MADPGNPDDRRDSRRRMERANVSRRLKGVYLSCPALSDRDIRVVNLSEFGVGIETPGLGKVLPVGASLEGGLRVGYARVPLKIRLVHANPTVSGFEFIEPSEKLKSAIRSIFQPELVGASMRLVGHKARKTLLGPTEVRYTDGKSNTLSLLVTNERVNRFSIGVMGNVIEWTEGRPLQCIQNARPVQLDEFSRKQLVKLVASVGELPPEHEKEIEHVLLSA